MASTTAILNRPYYQSRINAGCVSLLRYLKQPNTLAPLAEKRKCLQILLKWYSDVWKGFDQHGYQLTCPEWARAIAKALSNSRDAGTLLSSQAIDGIVSSESTEQGFQLIEWVGKESIWCPFPILDLSEMLMGTPLGEGDGRPSGSSDAGVGLEMRGLPPRRIGTVSAAPRGRGRGRGRGKSVAVATTSHVVRGASEEQDADPDDMEVDSGTPGGKRRIRSTSTSTPPSAEQFTSDPGWVPHERHGAEICNKCLEANLACVGPGRNASYKGKLIEWTACVRCKTKKLKCGNPLEPDTSFMASHKRPAPTKLVAPMISPSLSGSSIRNVTIDIPTRAEAKMSKIIARYEDVEPLGREHLDHAVMDIKRYVDTRVEEVLAAIEKLRGELEE